MPSKWPRINWNLANAELANRPFADIFKERKMEPCPYCGHDTTKLDSWQVIYNDVHMEYAFVCQGCGARGPNDVSPAKAEEMWNLRRPDDARVAELAAALRAMLADTVAEDGSRRWPSKETVAQAQAALAQLEVGG